MDRVEKEGLLHIPKTARDANQPLPSTGIVVKLGEEFKKPWATKSDALQEGAMIMFSRFAGMDFRIDEQDFRILEENEIVCTLEDTQGVVVPVKED
jgi:co-chaperonin GroES (HSP10)